MENQIKTCLLVEDDQDDQDFFTNTLNEISETTICYTVENGIEAVHALTKDKIRPHYIFTDLNMPEMNGFEFLKTIKNMEGLQHIPVIVYSSGYTGEDIIKLKALGATALYPKTKFLMLKEILSKYFN